MRNEASESEYVDRTSQATDIAKEEKEAKSPMRGWDTPTTQEESRLNSDDLIPRRVRLGKHTHLPVASALREAPQMDPVIRDKKLSMWMAKGKGKPGVSARQGCGGHRQSPATDKYRGKRSYWPSRWRTGTTGIIFCPPM